MLFTLQSLIDLVPLLLLFFKSISPCSLKMVFRVVNLVFFIDFYFKFPKPQVCKSKTELKLHSNLNDAFNP